MEPSESNTNQKIARRTIPHLVVFSFAVLCLCALRYFQIIIGKAVFDSPVHVRYLEPTTEFFKESLLAGRLPFWNPYCYLGMPQLPGCFTGNFYPLNAILLIPGYEAGCVVFLLVHQFVQFLGAYLVAARFQSRVVARVIPACLYLIVSIILVGDSNLALAATLAWLPFCLFGVLRCVPQGDGKKPHRAGLVVTNSCFVALLLLSGALALSLSVTFVFVIFLIARKFHLRNASDLLRPSIASYLLSIALAVCLAAPVLLPVLEWSKSSSIIETGINLVRAIPNCASVSCLWSGPQTLDRLTRDLFAIKTVQMMRGIVSLAGHQGRYLVVQPDKELSAENESPICRSVAPNANMRIRIASPLGYLGHPSPSYRAFVEGAIEQDPTTGFLKPPDDSTNADRLLRFSQFTSTAMIVSSDWPDAARKRTGFSDCRNQITTFNGEPPQWHCFRQSVVLPVAYSIDAWHWVKDQKEILDRHFVANEEFDPRKLLLVEKGDTIELDEERLDKMPFSQVNPPSGPPLTDSEKIETGSDETRSKPVDVLLFEPEHISLSVNVERPSFIVMTDTFYPGWKAYVDSTPAPLYRANGIGRAVFVTEGPHLVAFDFRSNLLRLGGTLAVGGLVVVFILSFFWLSRLLGKVIRYLSVGKFE